MPMVVPVSAMTRYCMKPTKSKEQSNNETATQKLSKQKQTDSLNERDSSKTTYYGNNTVP